MSPDTYARNNFLRFALIAEIRRRLAAGEALSYGRTEADAHWSVTARRVNGAEELVFDGYADYLQGTITRVDQLPLHELALLLDPLHDYSRACTPPTQHEILAQRQQAHDAVEAYFRA